MKTAKTIFCIVALTLLAQLVTTRSHASARAWEFEPQPCDGPQQIPKVKLLCSDPDLRAADIALSKAYKEKIAQLEPAEVDALRADSRVWWLLLCLADLHLDDPHAEAARACLKREFDERRQIVLALPTDRPKGAYLFSHTELDLLRGYGSERRDVIYSILDHNTALAVGLRRVFAAVLPRKLEVPIENASADLLALSRFSIDAFLHAAFEDTSHLEYDRYFVDYGRKSNYSSDQGMFVVDLKTGETALAFIDSDKSSLVIWEKACASTSFRDESAALFRKYATQSLASVHELDAFIRDEVAGEIHSTPCK